MAELQEMSAVRNIFPKRETWGWRAGWNRNSQNDGCQDLSCGGASAAAAKL